MVTSALGVVDEADLLVQAGGRQWDRSIGT